jgi:5-formyltetrahydrofolate cyclo-ligase
MIRVYSQEDLATFIPNRWGIPEPPPLPPLSSSPHRQVSSELDSLDLILAPGLGFEVETKNRIGRGKGYYDKFIQEAIKTNVAKGHPPPLTSCISFSLSLLSPISLVALL